MVITSTTQLTDPKTVVMKQELTASIVFSSMPVFDMLKVQLGMIFSYINVTIAGKVSLDRVDNFLHNVGD